jgi:hypothetical protein
MRRHFAGAASALDLLCSFKRAAESGATLAPDSASVDLPAATACPAGDLRFLFAKSDYQREGLFLA